MKLEGAVGLRRWERVYLEGVFVSLLPQVALQHPDGANLRAEMATRVLAATLVEVA